VIEADINAIDGRQFRGVDLVSAGVPCPPFSIAGKQLGRQDERDLFPAALRIIDEAQPSVVMFENVRGLASKRFTDYRRELFGRLTGLGYEPSWRLLLASDFAVPQLRPRFVLIGLKFKYAEWFRWPSPTGSPLTVGETLYDLMAERGWKGARAWSRRASKIAPTIVGGSRKHGGPDLGPTRARREWLALGVDGLGIADEPPGTQTHISHVPRLTLRMVARLQGFGDSWTFAGKKTAAYRQVGNAFPPPVATQVALALLRALRQEESPNSSEHRRPYQHELGPVTV
jgi:DNA (cytosine-5)-methyltransferase 1